MWIPSITVMLLRLKDEGNTINRRLWKKEEGRKIKTNKGFEMRETR